MIFDRLDNAGWYCSHPWWHELVEFIRKATADLPDGEHPLPSYGIVARVFSTQTKPRSSCQLESHRACIDVQAALAGREVISVWPVPILTPCTEYDEGRDVRFYDPPAEAPAMFPLMPGAFAVFFPHDAHMTLIAPDHPAPIKKLVAKVPASLFQS
jgi:YhcH/YjgK/YiaL family protein